jgi:fibronectin type 3 domain-containing protein
MQIKKYHAPLFLILLIMGASVTWGLFVFNPQAPAHVKEIADAGYVPGQPTNLTAVLVTENKINLTWTAPDVDELFAAAPSQYVIYRSLTGSDFDSILPIATISSATTDYSDQSVAPETTYYYKVAAKNGTGEGINSNVYQATTPALPVLTATGLTASAQTTSQIKLSWVQPAANLTYEIYRKTASDGSASLVAAVPSTDVFLDQNLSSQTTYSYFIISRRGINTSDPTETVSATTLAPSSSGSSSTPPPAPSTTITLPTISDIQVNISTSTATIFWKTNVATNGEVRYGATSVYDQKKSDPAFKTSHQIVLDLLTPKTVYHFQIISVDNLDYHVSSSDNTFTTLEEIVLPKNVSDLQVSSSSQKILLTWKNPSTQKNNFFDGVKVVRKISSPSLSTNDGTTIYTGMEESFVDTSALEGTRYVYTVYTFDTKNNFSSGVTAEGLLVSTLVKIDQCNLSAIDCTLAACRFNQVCIEKTTPVPVLIPTKPTTPKNNVTIFSKLNLLDFKFFTGEGLTPTTPENGTVEILERNRIRVVFPENKLPTPPKGLVLQVAGENDRTFIYDRTKKEYYVEFDAPSNGWYEGIVVVNETKNTSETIPFIFHFLPFGTITDNSNNSGLLTGAEIRLYDKASNKLVDLSNSKQKNPSTSSDGRFGFVVPEGQYLLTVSKDGYITSTSSLNVSSPNVINSQVQLIPLNSALFGSFSPRSAAAQKQLNTFTEKVLAPWSIGLAAISLLAQVSLFDLLGLLRLIFLQPILLIGSRKRQAWGQVYNALNKLPVDLAVIRLVDNTTNRIVQSMVTGKNGKYYFKATPGDYRLEASKDHMTFPSEILKKYKSDGRKTDLYHGEMLSVKDYYPIITANIPGDPTVESKTPARLRWEKAGRTMQFIIAISGCLLTGYSLYNSPSSWFLWVLLCTHIVVFMLFYRLAIPPKPRGWGIVFDKSSRKPVVQAVVRLFNTNLNKLVSSQITDHQGRYYFLAGDSTYQLSFANPDYIAITSQPIDLTGKEEENIALNVGLDKKE